MKQESKQKLYLVTTSISGGASKDVYVIAEDEGEASRVALNEFKNEYKYIYDYVSNIKLVAENYQYSNTGFILLFATKNLVLED